MVKRLLDFLNASPVNFLALPSVPVYLRLTVIDILFSCLSPWHPTKSKKTDSIKANRFIYYSFSTNA